MYVPLKGDPLKDDFQPMTDQALSEASFRRLGVRLDPFFLAKHEVTQGQWQRWTEGNPSDRKKENSLSLPVASVDWYMCNDTLAKFGLVLPSHLQWEYGVRGGTTTRWWTGDDEKEVAAAENIGFDLQLLPVGSKRPNPFGLYDMGGNVMEWCYDQAVHETRDESTARPGDGRLPTVLGIDRATRFCCGGSVGSDTEAALSSRGLGPDALEQRPYIGLRPVRSLRI